MYLYSVAGPYWNLRLRTGNNRADVSFWCMLYSFDPVSKAIIYSINTMLFLQCFWAEAYQNWRGRGEGAMDVFLEIHNYLYS